VRLRRRAQRLGHLVLFMVVLPLATSVIDAGAAVLADTAGAAPRGASAAG